MRIESGLVIGNRFRLLEQVGAGDFGSLWCAADRIPGKKVAVRIIRTQGAAAAALDAFESEMTSAMEVCHRALARIYAAGREPSGAVWFARELVDGESLESALDRGGPLSPVAALTMMGELAGVLSEVHARGLAHGAVSARMVLVQRLHSDAMRPMLIGIGRARFLGSKLPRVTVHGLPEAAYFSPEVFASRQYGAASDVWSLGVLLFRCVTGRLPFDAQNQAAMQVETRRMGPRLAVIDDVRVRSVVEECFALDPDARPNASALSHRARLLVGEALQEQRVANVSRTAAAVSSATAPAEMAPPSTATSPPVVESAPSPALASSASSALASSPSSALASSPLPVVRTAARVASSETAALLAARHVAAPVARAVDDDVVDFRPRRSSAKLLLGAAAAAAIIVEIIVATREPRHESPVVGPVDNQAIVTPVPPPRVEAAAVTTPPSPVASTTQAAPTSATAKPIPALAAAPKAVAPKSPPAATASAAPRPAENGDQANPYE